MNNLAIFLGSALLITAAALLLVLSAFRRRTAGADFSRKQLNAAIYRDELAELDSDLAEGSLTQADYDQARAELQRRLLEDSSAGEAEAALVPSGRAVPIALAVTLPVAAALLYMALGNPAALNPKVTQPQQQFTEADIERMVAGLAAKLESEPDNIKGWAMLARSYKAMGRLPEALSAYERTGSLMDSNADLVLDYADTLAATTGGFTPKVLALIDKALTLEPEHPQGLWLRGTAFYETKQYGKALKDWEALLKLMPPGSENERVVAANVAEVKELQAKAGKPGNEKTGSGKTAAAGDIRGRVELAPALSGKLPNGAQIMVVARPADGSRMPVAVLRARAAFPLEFTLDDSLAMSPERLPSQFSELVLEARVSASGQAVPQPGDLFGPPVTAKLGTRGINLTVDQVRQ